MQEESGRRSCHRPAAQQRQGQEAITQAALFNLLLLTSFLLSFTGEAESEQSSRYLLGIWCLGTVPRGRAAAFWCPATAVSGAGGFHPDFLSAQDAALSSGLLVVISSDRVGYFALSCADC